MKIQFASDLHLEFAGNKSYLQKKPLVPAGDVLVLSGDIMPLAQLNQHAEFLDRLSDGFEQVYWIPGNHEYYHFDIANHSGAFHEKVRPNISLLNNQTVNLSGLTFHFTTLWSQLSLRNERAVERGLSDFRLIRVAGNPLSVHHYNRMHNDSVVFLDKAFKREQLEPGIGKTIVVTHHVPTFQHYPRQWLGNILNEAFATDLDWLIDSSGADYWIYGHNHAATPEFKVGITKLLTNQLGYVHYNEHEKFDAGRVLVFD
ncbi:metallophosphoesterase [Mucilaginibacter agri]|uniref:Metallophosphoesterase n=1 Tax=Mucilaginibacter agri TaxID=2695265 RepID=A0A965ZBA3_9SPHI|nr:metallophosphoesterase [Mucilaginibacter agri]NCD67878.1 metallophosphoesterase [Mucilaginibacter agri]